MGVCNCSMFCCTLLYVLSSIVIILIGKRELVALLNLSSWCLVMVERLFLAVPRGCLRFVIVVFPDHTHLLFLWSCQKMCDALHYRLDNIFIRFGLKLYRQIVGIPMGTYCAPFVAVLFLFCYERDFMLSLSDNNQTDIIEAFNPPPDI